MAAARTYYDVAREVTEARDAYERDRAIRKAHASGIGERRLAELTGLSQLRIRQLVETRD